MKNQEKKSHIINLNEESLSDILGKDHGNDKQQQSSKKKSQKAFSAGMQNIQQLKKKLAREAAEKRARLHSNGLLSPNQQNNQKINAEVNNNVPSVLKKENRGKAKGKKPTVSQPITKSDLPLSHILNKNKGTGGKNLPAVIVKDSPSLRRLSDTRIGELEDNNIIIPERGVFDNLNRYNQERVQNKVRWEDNKRRALDNILKPKSPANVGKLPMVIANRNAANDLSTVLGTEIPTEVNAINLTNQLVEATQNLPDYNSDEFFDKIEVKFDKTKKDKTGYYKITTNIKKENIPQIINRIASYVKLHTKGVIKPRVCDLRVIANTNKNQLRGSHIKLTSATVVFKPRHTVMKVNKMTRIMLSIPENFLSTGRLLVYIQESRNKNILEISISDFQSENHFIEFLGNTIANYFTVGFSATNRTLRFKNVHNPLMTVITNVLKTREFNCDIDADDSTNEIITVTFTTKGTSNEWLYIEITKANEPGKYAINGKSLADDTINIPGKKVTIDYLEKHLYKILKDAFSKDWTSGKDSVYAEYDDKEYAKFVYNVSKLKHYKLVNAAYDIFETLALPIHALSKNETREEYRNLHDDKDYDCESVLFKNAKVGLSYALLSYLGFQQIAGDKRWGRDYITTEGYYVKYHVKDKRPYPERERTVLKKEGIERRYNARIYLFQLEYTYKGKQHKFRAQTWEEVKEQTGILTDNILFPPTLY